MRLHGSSVLSATTGILSASGAPNGYVDLWNADPPSCPVKRRSKTIRAWRAVSIHRFQGFQCFLLGEGSREFTRKLMLIVEQGADVEDPHRGPWLSYDCAEVVR